MDTVEEELKESEYYKKHEAIFGEMTISKMIMNYSLSQCHTLCTMVNIDFLCSSFDATLRCLLLAIAENNEKDKTFYKNQFKDTLSKVEDVLKWAQEVEDKTQKEIKSKKLKTQP